MFVNSLGIRLSAVCLIILVVFYLINFSKHLGKLPNISPITPERSYVSVTRHLPLPGPCTCPNGSEILKDHLPKEKSEELKQRRAKEIQQNKNRTTSVLSRLLFALPNSPLQYPIQGYTVQPLTSTVIPARSSPTALVSTPRSPLLGPRSY